jgi:CDP-4-dehydro-6-deoxyglucose reductase, E1
MGYSARVERHGSTRKRLSAALKAAVAANKKVLAPPPGRVTVGWPVFDYTEIGNALDALLAMRISQGPKVREFEALAARYIGKKYAVAVNSGSSANLLALSALVQAGKVPRGSEVIIPATTFSTVASPIIQVGLVPVYVDIDPKSWNIDPKQIEKAITKKTRVIMPVHTFGNPADMPAIMRIARKHKLLVLEDCCEAHGAMIGKKKVGSFGHLATLSFFVAHNITTGEGGMIFTDSAEEYELLQSLREFGRLPLETMQTKRFTYKDKVLRGYDARYIFTRLGYNVRMTDIAAGIGIAQIGKLDRLNRQRLSIVQQYMKTLAPYRAYLTLPVIEKSTFHSFYGFPFLVKRDAPFSRMDLVMHLEKNGIETRPFFGGCLPDQPGFRDEPKRIVGQLPVARMIRDQSVFIGCHPGLTPQHVEHVIKTFNTFLAKF